MSQPVSVVAGLMIAEWQVQLGFAVHIVPAARAGKKKSMGRGAEGMHPLQWAG